MRAFGGGHNADAGHGASWMSIVAYVPSSVAPFLGVSRSNGGGGRGFVDGRYVDFVVQSNANLLLCAFKAAVACVALPSCHASLSAGSNSLNVAVSGDVVGDLKLLERARMVLSPRPDVKLLTSGSPAPTGFVQWWMRSPAAAVPPSSSLSLAQSDCDGLTFAYMRVLRMYASLLPTAEVLRGWAGGEVALTLEDVMERICTQYTASQQIPAAVAPPIAGGALCAQQHCPCPAVLHRLFNWVIHNDSAGSNLAYLRRMEPAIPRGLSGAAHPHVGVGWGLLDFMQTPYQYLLLMSDPAAETDFRERREAAGGSRWAFHGSKRAHWHAILHNGLANMSGTSGQVNGAVHGEGVYFAPKAVDSLHYSGAKSISNTSSPPSSPASAPDPPLEPSAMVCLALCEIIEGTYRGHRFNGSRAANGCYTVKRREDIKVRFLFVYPQGTHGIPESAAAPGSVDMRDPVMAATVQTLFDSYNADAGIPRRGGVRERVGGYTWRPAPPIAGPAVVRRGLRGHFAAPPAVPAAKSRANPPAVPVSRAATIVINNTAGGVSGGAVASSTTVTINGNDWYGSGILSACAGGAGVRARSASVLFGLLVGLLGLLVAASISHFVECDERGLTDYPPLFSRGAMAGEGATLASPAHEPTERGDYEGLTSTVGSPRWSVPTALSHLCVDFAPPHSPTSVAAKGARTRRWSYEDRRDSRHHRQHQRRGRREATEKRHQGLGASGGFPLTLLSSAFVGRTLASAYDVWEEHVVETIEDRVLFPLQDTLASSYYATLGAVGEVGQSVYGSIGRVVHPTGEIKFLDYGLPVRNFDGIATISFPAISWPAVGPGFFDSGVSSDRSAFFRTVKGVCWGVVADITPSFLLGPPVPQPSYLSAVGAFASSVGSSSAQHVRWVSLQLWRTLIFVLECFFAMLQFIEGALLSIASFCLHFMCVAWLWVARQVILHGYHMVAVAVRVALALMWLVLVLCRWALDVVLVVGGLGA